MDIENFSVLAISWDISDYLQVYTRTSAYNSNWTFNSEEFSVHFLRCLWLLTSMYNSNKMSIAGRKIIFVKLA